MDQVIFKNIPDELKMFSNWVAWRFENIRGRAKSAKVPINPKTGERASVTNPAHWGAFGESVIAMERYEANGIGLVLAMNTKAAGITCIDLDSCRDAETGEWSPEVLEIIKNFNSYTEISQSGKGLHLFIKAEWPEDGKRAGIIEIYKNKRFIAMTGNLLGV